MGYSYHDSFNQSRAQILPEEFVFLFKEFTVQGSKSPGLFNGKNENKAFCSFLSNVPSFFPEN